jgi:peptidoglycan/LPS O-acetylase OafA/YrhL
LNKYRADIDGLRAIAVISVVMYHAFPSFFRGGFVGVDIFFVLSGYLISAIVLEKLHDGTFSFTEFFMRRIRRIFPALVLVLSLCLCFGWLALLPDDYKQLGKHTAGGAGFLSNFLFWKESGYFVGRTEFDSPEVDNEVLIPAEQYARLGDFVHVKINKAEEFDLYGDIVSI